MPRGPRKFEIGGVYHIMNRGVDKRNIFLKNQDYSRFILGLEFFNSDKPINIYDVVGKSPAIVGSDPTMATMAGSTMAGNHALEDQATADPAMVSISIKERLTAERKKNKNKIVELLVFTLMSNHYHLIVREIVSGGISFFMKKIGGYSNYFNKQYGRSGSLFESRYKLIKIEDDSQLATVFVYAHTNPVEIIESMWKMQKVNNFGKAINFLNNYKWSSYKDYIGEANFPFSVNNKDFFLKFFDQQGGCKKAVEDWIRFKAANKSGNINFNIFE